MNPGLFTDGLLSGNPSILYLSFCLSGAQRKEILSAGLLLCKELIVLIFFGEANIPNLRYT